MVRGGVTYRKGKPLTPEEAHRKPKAYCDVNTVAAGAGAAVAAFPGRRGE
jgi:hypothetical protein